MARPWQRKFLGYGMTGHQKPKLRIAAPSLEKLTEKVRTLLCGARGRSLEATVQRLNPVLRGWAAYFKLTETKRRLHECDGWIRHKMRCILWRQWKRPYARARNLMKRGLTEQRAWRSATNGRGPWWNAGASPMHAAFPKSWFDTLGLVSLLDTVQRLQRVSSTAGCETARPVVWEAAGVIPPPTRSNALCGPVVAIRKASVLLTSP